MLRKVWRLPNASSCLGFAEKVWLLFRTLKPFWVRFLELPRLTLASASSERRRRGAVYRDSGTRARAPSHCTGSPLGQRRRWVTAGGSEARAACPLEITGFPGRRSGGRPLRLAPCRFPLRDPGRLLARGSLALGAWARPPAPGMRGPPVGCTSKRPSSPPPGCTPALAPRNFGVCSCCCCVCLLCFF